jgi:predicted nuclease of predicted toxin-antitoxin system
VCLASLLRICVPKPMIRMHTKPKLLLDENFPPRARLPKLNQRYDVKHIRDDFGFVGLKDPQVYEVAVKEHRLLVTFNPDDFRPLVENREASGVIGVSHNFTNAQIDTKLVALLRKMSRKRLYGQFHYISGESRHK